MKKKIIKALLPALLILLISAGAGRWMMTHRKKPEKKIPEEVVTRAEYVHVSKENYVVTLTTSGEVLPRTKSTLIPQVAGEVLEISPNFRNGGFFEVGELLLKLDDRDYSAAVTEASASLAQAQATLQLEEARSAQAIASWEELGRGGKPSDLTMRKPQLAEAKATAEAAAARLARAKRDLERTGILAPYAGYVRQKSVDIGQFVSQGTPLGEIFAVDYVEVRLPIDPADLPFVDLPERYRRGEISSEHQPKVLLRDFNNTDITWSGRIVLAEGEFDNRSRKLFIIAQVDDPYGQHKPGLPPLKVGQFVQAEIEGKEIADVFVIPEQAVLFMNEVKVIDKEDRIRFREVKVVWADLPNYVVRDGLEEGDRLCITKLPFAVDGAKVDPVERKVVEELEKTPLVQPGDSQTEKKSSL